MVENLHFLNVKAPVNKGNLSVNCERVPLLDPFKEGNKML